MPLGGSSGMLPVCSVSRVTSGILRRPRAALIVAAAFSTAVLSSVVYQEAAAARDRCRFPAPGRLVDIGGRRLHLLEAGDGSPAVVVVPAMSEGGLTWVRIQRELAAEMRVVLYDRAGTGWSDAPARGRRTFDDAAAELRALLDSSGIAPPYVLVSHSLGGVIARRFAALYPGTVAGMVLVDSSHEGQASRHGIDGWPNGRASYYRRALRWRARPLGLRRLAAAAGLTRQLDADAAREVLPGHAGAYRAVMLSTRLRRTVIRETLMMARLSAAPSPLASTPLTVITAGQALPGWLPMQQELAALSSLRPPGRPGTGPQGHQRHSAQGGRQATDLTGSYKRHGRSGECGIRTHGNACTLQRFSRPQPSATVCGHPRLGRSARRRQAAAAGAGPAGRDLVTRPTSRLSP
jgi:pimeloyl-ACP methyl ester carboxylesterase